MLTPAFNQCVAGHAGPSGGSRALRGSGAAYPWCMAEIDPAAVEQVASAARAARVASRRLALLSRADKDAALLALADALEAATDRIVAANGEDLDRGRESGMPQGLLDRLALDPQRVAA